MVPDFCPREGKCRVQETCSQERKENLCPGLRGDACCRASRGRLRCGWACSCRSPSIVPNSGAASAELLRQGQFSPGYPQALCRSPCYSGRVSSPTITVCTITVTANNEEEKKTIACSLVKISFSRRGGHSHSWRSTDAW